MGVSALYVDVVLLLQEELHLLYEFRFVKREDILTYMPDLKRYANYLCKNPDDAQDLMQNTFEKSWVKFNRFTRSVNLKSWLLKIMYNSFIDGIRSKKFGEDNHQEYLESYINQEYEINHLMDLDKAIAMLEPELKSVLVLATIEGYDYKTIAKTMSIPTGTVMSRLHHARSLLRQVFEVNKKKYKYTNIVEMKYEQK